MSSRLGIAPWGATSWLLLLGGCFDPNPPGTGGTDTDPTSTTAGTSTSSVSISTAPETTSVTAGSAVCGNGTVEADEACDDPSDAACVDCRWVDATSTSTAGSSGEASTMERASEDASTGTSSDGSTGDANTTVEPDGTSSTGMETETEDSGEPICGATVTIDRVTIAGGSFTDAGNGPQESHPIAAFALARTEVTVADYERCAADGDCPRPASNADASTCNYGGAERADHPVNCVTWEQAATFCRWVCGRLPTEWEWEWAARGRGTARAYPWGDTPVPTCTYAVMNDADNGGSVGCGESHTAVVGSRSPAGDSLDGVSDLAGNVSEWTDSLFDPEGTETNRVLRGGDWFFGVAATLRVDARASSAPDAWSLAAGFRCAWDAP